MKLALPAAALLLLTGALLAFQRPQRSEAAEVLPAPGQLAILDRKGQPAGLCPLKHTDVNADVSGFVARVNVRQEFENTAKEPVEAVYTFPLPEDAAVDDMTMTLGKRVIRGEIKKREEARQIYEAAKANGQSAALLDQERPNIFTQSVANVMPGDRVTISISYVNLLKYDEGGYQFVFPMVVGPRYTPGGGYTVPGQRGNPSPPQAVEGDPGARSVVTDADKITPPITPPDTRAGHDISMTVSLDAGMPLRDVKCQLHDIAVDRKGENAAVVRLKDEKTIPNKDFILRYQVAGDRMQTGLLAHSEGAKNGKTDGYFTLILQPPAAPPQKDVSPKEMVFVIDQTGSQGGWPIQKAKETMRFCIENLNPGDTFQLLAFNTQVFPCFSAPVPVTPENTKTALQFIEPLEGNGGTDILKAVDYVLKIPADPARLRMVCYMTDGYVGNDMQIIQFIRQNRGTTRMFPFGVGNSVNRFLIDGMAKEGRGAPEYVTLNMPGEKAASKFYSRVAKPLLLDPKIEWNGMPVADVFPQAIPDVFTAGPIIVKGRYTRAGEGDIQVRGTLRGQPWSQTVHVTFPAVEKDGAAIPTLWARERIEDLQSQDWTGAQTGNPDPKIKDQIVATALDYRLMSQYTSFVAVEQKVVNVGGKQRRVDVPVEMPEGVSYEGIFGEDRAQGLRGAVALSRRSGVMFRTNGAGYGNAVGGLGGAGGGGFGSSGLGLATQPAPQSAPALRAKSARPSTSAAAAPAAPPISNPRSLAELQKEELKDGIAVGDADFASDTPAAKKRLDAMKPQERLVVLRQAKLAEPFQGLAEKLKKEGRNGSLSKPGLPGVTKGRVDVQMWLNSLPPDGLRKLKALGFDLITQLMPGKLLFGTAPVAQLDALVALGWVRRVEPPRYK